jgi:hypothetical protein
VLLGQRVLPVGQDIGVLQDFGDANANDHRVEQQIGDDQPHRDADCFSESPQENCGKQGKEKQRDPHLVSFQDIRRKRIFQNVRRCVGRGQGDGNDEVSCNEPKQHEDKELPLPPAK